MITVSNESRIFKAGDKLTAADINIMIRQLEGSKPFAERFYPTNDGYLSAPAEVRRCISGSAIMWREGSDWCRMEGSTGQMVFVGETMELYVFAQDYWWQKATTVYLESQNLPPQTPAPLCQIIPFANNQRQGQILTQPARTAEGRYNVGSFEAVGGDVPGVLLNDYNGNQLALMPALKAGERWNSPSSGREWRTNFQYIRWQTQGTIPSNPGTLIYYG